MKFLSFFFFYTYIGLVIIAGFWGAFINPYFDFKQLFQLDPFSLQEFSRVNALSQYRFLRALELGFGLFSILFVKKIFSERSFNLLFIIMGSGVLARIISWLVDGRPSSLFMFFMLYELIGLIFIFIYTINKVAPHAIIQQR